MFLSGERQQADAHLEDSAVTPFIFTLQPYNMASNPKVPIPLSTDDTPTVRNYIVKVLKLSHDFTTESAHHSAAEWKTGIGADLRQMKAPQYRETFGNRVARILYREVRIQVLEEEHAKRKPLSRETRGMTRRSERDRAVDVELMFDYRRVYSCYHDHREPCDAGLRFPFSTCDRICDICVLGVGALYGCPFG